MPSTTAPDGRLASALSYRDTRRRARSRSAARIDRPAVLVELDGKVGDAARGDVGGHVDLAATDDAEVDHAAAGGGVEPGVGGRQAGLVEGVHQLGERLRLVDPAEELPDGPEVLDVVDQRGAGEGHQQGTRDAGPDALGELQDVLRALGGLVLDEVRLVDDHAAEAEVAEPAHMAVEHLVVDDDDVGEAVDRVTVAVDHGGRAVGRPEAGLARPVGLDDVRHDHEQRVGVRRLRGEQRLSRLAQARLVGEQEGPVAGRGGGDQLRLVRHQLQATRRVPGGRRGKGHARRGSAAGALERAEERAEQLPTGQAASDGPCSAGRTRSRGRGRGWPAVARRPTAARPDARWWRTAAAGSVGATSSGAGSIPAALSMSRLSDLAASETTASSARSASSAGVADGGLREDRRDPVEALELLGPVGVAAGLVRPDPGVLLAHQQCDDLELRAHARASRGRAGRPPRPHGRRGRAPR